MCRLDASIDKSGICNKSLLKKMQSHPLSTAAVAFVNPNNGISLIS